MLQPDGPKYEFLAGDYVLEVFAQVFGERAPVKVGNTMRLSVTKDDAMACKDEGTGVVFNWVPDGKEDRGKPLSVPEVKIPEILQLFGKFAASPPVTTA